MLVKLLTNEEEREVTVVDAVAVEISQEDISAAIKAEDNGKIPNHLKRIKKEKTRVLMLKGREIGDIPNGITVSVPEFEPITKKQYEMAKDIWPCYFYNHFVEKIKQAVCIERMMQTLEFYHKQYPSASDKAIIGHYCSGVCLIFNESYLLCKSVDREYILGHAVAEGVTEVSKLEGNYLCTGYSAFLYQEPCVSCAMSLVHGRIKRVFCYKKGAEIDMCPFSKFKFNYNKFLNHRFCVYFYQEW